MWLRLSTTFSHMLSGITGGNRESEWEREHINNPLLWSWIILLPAVMRRPLRQSTQWESHLIMSILVSINFDGMCVYIELYRINSSHWWNVYFSTCINDFMYIDDNMVTVTALVQFSPSNISVIQRYLGLANCPVKIFGYTLFCVFKSFTDSISGWGLPSTDTGASTTASATQSTPCASEYTYCRGI